jgi:MEDS: MEthanogen/methylotroph, DcmR Sensory domain
MSQAGRFTAHAHRERLLRGPTHSEHIVHFFDDESAREAAVGTFVEDGLKRGRSVLLVARPALWPKVALHLKRTRTSVSPDARLVVLDANVILGSLMRRGRFAPELFHENIAPLVKSLAAASVAGLAAYDEIVDILASEQNLRAAGELEKAWNGLAAQVSLTLLCGYGSAHFAVAERRLMSMICAAHSRVNTDSGDTLGRWLVDNRGDAMNYAP